jgi:hypothetical protein
MIDEIYNNEKEKNETVVGKNPTFEGLDNNHVAVDENVKVGGNRIYILLCSCFNGGII